MKHPAFILQASCLIMLIGCAPAQPEAPSTEALPEGIVVEGEERSAAPHSMNEQIVSDNTSPDLLRPEDFTYLGAFRLPEDPGGGSNWDYSGQALTYYPEGDPGGAADGTPGSLFGAGHDHQLFISEISIPAPVNSRNLADLNTAVTLQPFADITGGMITENMDLPRFGLEYRPADGRLYFSFGQWFQDFEPSHGWAGLNLSEPQPAGPLTIAGYTNYVSNEYLFALPEDWATANTGGLSLATGRFREGVWAGSGPALLAIAPWQAGNSPVAGTEIEALPLLLYGTQVPGLTDIVSEPGQWMNGYLEADHWWDAAWLEAGGRAAVVFSGTKALRSSWYGFADGTVWEYDCAERNPPTCPPVPEWPYDSRGYWAESYQAQLLFFDPADLAAVARGEQETWEPQPYALLALNDVLFDPEIHLEEYKTDLIGSIAYDSANGLLYVMERLADDYRSVVHVWRVGGS